MSKPGSEKSDLDEQELDQLRLDVKQIEDDNVLKNDFKEISALTKVVEEFLVHGNLICYGGQAINNILPRHKRFYSAISIPDYDFFSTNAMADAKKLADIFYKLGYYEVNAKVGVHYGTFAVFVNYIKVADITQQNATLFENMMRESITIAGISYAPPNWLRMGMYIELSRPQGDVSRWEKVLPRLNLLNEFYPLKILRENCKVGFGKKETQTSVLQIAQSVLLNENVVFFGGYALEMYLQGEKNGKFRMTSNNVFEVLSLNAANTAATVVETLQQAGFHNVTSVAREPIGEVIPLNIEIKLGPKSLIFIYQPEECSNYNEIEIEQDIWLDGNIISGNHKISVRIATIDTILRFYLAFMFSSGKNSRQFDVNRLICSCDSLLKLQQNNRLIQTGILKRFSMACLGPQATLKDLKKTKTKKLREFRSIKKKNKNDNYEYNKWFLNYTPTDKKTKRTTGSK